MMNHRFVVDMSAGLAERLETASADPSEQLQAAFELAFGRAANESERAVGVKLINDHGLKVVCRALLNANELIYVE
jgi:hypothetical protein